MRIKFRSSGRYFDELLMTAGLAVPDWQRQLVAEASRRFVRQTHDGSSLTAHPLIQPLIRMPIETNLGDLTPLRAGGEVILWGRSLLRGKDASLVISEDQITCYIGGERAQPDHPLQSFANTWEGTLKAYHRALLNEPNGILVLTGRWADPSGNVDGTFVAYIAHILKQDGVISGPFGHGLISCDVKLAGTAIGTELSGWDEKHHEQLRHHTWNLATGENCRWGYGTDPMVEGMLWWFEDQDCNTGQFFTMIHSPSDEFRAPELDYQNRRPLAECSDLCKFYEGVVNG